MVSESSTEGSTFLPVDPVIIDNGCYLEVTLRESRSLCAGDRIQVFINNRRRTDRNDPHVELKVLEAGKVKGQDFSTRMSGMWRRFTRARQAEMNQQSQPQKPAAED